jgi:hypothetical protein
MITIIRSNSNHKDFIDLVYLLYLNLAKWFDSDKVILID